MQLLVELIDPSFEPPAFQTAGAVGLDLPARFPTTVFAKGSAVVEVPYKVQCPPGTFARIVMRSGHGFKHDLACHVGTLDEDYRGQVKVKVFNLSDRPYTIDRGERFAQMILLPALRPEVVVVGSLEATERGEGGFGSTGR